MNNVANMPMKGNSGLDKTCFTSERSKNDLIRDGDIIYSYAEFVEIMVID